MLKVFFGNDTESVRQAAHEAMKAEVAAGKELSTIDGDSYYQGILTDTAGAMSLFGGATCYIIDTPTEKKELQEELASSLTVLAESPNQFVVIEGPLLAVAKKAYAKVTDDVQEFSKKAPERFNTFALADALANKKKKDLWMGLQNARAAGIAAEEIIGVLWWQLKSLRLAAMTQTASEAGMKDFPYKKAKGALRNFKDREVVALSESLLAVYHDGHAGVRDIDDALEGWVLAL